MRTLCSRSPSPSTSDTVAQPAAVSASHRRHHPVERDHHRAGRVRHFDRRLAHRRLERLTLRLPSRRQRFGQSVEAALRRLHVTEGGQHLLGVSRRQMRHQHRALACGERCPIALHDADLALQRRHRPLTAPGPIQRARHRHRTSAGEVGLRATACPAIPLSVDEHVGQVYIVAGERLLGDRALGLGEHGMEFAFEFFKAAVVRRFVLLQQGAHALWEFFERGPHITGSRFIDRRMGYFHWGSPPQCLEFALKHCCRGSLPRLPSAAYFP